MINIVATQIEIGCGRKPYRHSDAEKAQQDEQLKCCRTKREDKIDGNTAELSGNTQQQLFSDYALRCYHWFSVPLLRGCISVAYLPFFLVSHCWKGFPPHRFFLCAVTLLIMVKAINQWYHIRCVFPDCSVVLPLIFSSTFTKQYFVAFFASHCWQDLLSGRICISTAKPSLSDCFLNLFCFNAN